jgi:hypothetical protein
MVHNEPATFLQRVRPHLFTERSAEHPSPLSDGELAREFVLCVIAGNLIDDGSQYCDAVAAPIVRTCR